jgi:prepilin peptidase CpaA
LGVESYPIFNIGLLTDILLMVLILSAAITDFLKKRIYNFQTYPTMMAGLFLGFLFGGWKGGLASAAGLGAGIAILFVFFMVGGLGAGDVKLLGAIGALKGAQFVIWTMFYTGLVGGAVAIAVIVWKGTYRQTWVNFSILIRHPLMFMRSPDSSRTQADEQALQYLPYGLVISIGCLWALIAARQY